MKLRKIETWLIIPLLFGILGQATVDLRSTSRCGQTYFNSTSGIITSPNYRQPYPPNVKCSWEINAPPGNTFSMRFSDFQLSQTRACIGDFVQISIIKNNFTYCGRNNQFTFNSIRARIVTITFVSDATVDQSRGFQLNWQRLPLTPQPVSVCGNSFLTSSMGTLSSPGYNNNEYANDLFCEWTIAVQSKKMLNLRFDTFSLEFSSPCVNDYVAVYVGEKLISTYCGSTDPPPVSSANGNITIQFFSDSSVSSRGFQLSWENNPIQCPEIPTVNNGYVDCSAGSKVNSFCFISCEEGFEVDGDVIFNCSQDQDNNAYWTYNSTSCTARCPEIPTVINGNVDCTNGSNIESFCFIFCEEGFEADGDEFFNCVRDENNNTYWTYNSTICRVLDDNLQCNAITLENGVSSCTDRQNIGSVCTQQCSPGYILRGQITSRCETTNNISPQWVPPPPECEEANLYPSTETEYNPLPQGDRVTFTCNFIGFPAPNLTWRFANGTALPSTSQFQVEAQEVVDRLQSLKSLTVFGVTCQNASLLRFRCLAVNTDTPIPIESGVFVAGLDNSSLRLSGLTYNCSGAKSFCRNNGARLAILPSERSLSEVDTQQSETLFWISSASRDFFDVSISNRERTFPNPDGCTRVATSNTPWPYDQFSNSRVLCEYRVVPPLPNISTIGRACGGDVLNISWTLLPGAENLPHYVYASGQERITTAPGIRSLVLNGRTGKGKYRVQVVPAFLGCPATSPIPGLTVETRSEPPSTPKDILLVRNFVNNSCAVSWSFNSILEGDISAFAIRVTKNVTYQPRSSKPFDPSQQIIQQNSSARSYVINNLLPNTNYQIEIASISSPPCETFFPLEWNLSVQGTCVTEISVPSAIPLSQTPVSFNNRRPIITLLPVNERNGPISCYLLVVQKSSSIPRTFSEQDFMRLKQANEVLRDGDAYIAYTTSKITSNVDILLGDGSETCCDRSQYNSPSNCSVGSNRIRRSSLSEVRAQNLELKPGDEFFYYVLVSVPFENQTLWKSSDISSVIRIPPESPLYILYIVGGLVVIIGLIITSIVVYKVCSPSSNTINHKYDVHDEIVELPDIKKGESRRDSIGNLEHPYCEANDHPEPEEFGEYSIEMSNLNSTFLSKRENKNRGFRNEFEKIIPNITKISTEKSKLLEQKSKNRNQEILPGDSSRVELEEVNGNWRTSYINASYVNGYRTYRAYIAAQGPLKNTLNDFWRMILEHRCTKIAMVTKLKDKSKVYCEKYWPEVGHKESFGTTKVCNVVEENFGAYIRRELIISSSKNAHIKPVKVFHFQYLNWPEKGIPVTTSSLQRFMNSVIRRPVDGSVLVHGSEGAGRTGTLLALLLLKEQMKDSGKVNIVQTVKKLREARTGMISNLQQYIFIYKVLSEMTLIREETDCSSKHFHEYFQQMISINELHITNMRIQFDRLNILSNLHEEQAILQLVNGSNQIRPYERSEATLTSPGKKKKKDAIVRINASNIEANNPRISLMTIKTPENAIEWENFWKFVLQHKVKDIINITQIKQSNEAEKFKFNNFFTIIDRPVELGGYGYKVRKVKIFVGKYKERLDFAMRAQTIAKPDWILNRIDLPLWPEETVPQDIPRILTVADRIKNYHNIANHRGSTRGDYRVLVHCSDGSTRSGTFCALVNILDRLEREKNVDVFRSVKDLRDCRPKMVGNIQQYELIYKAVDHYLSKVKHIYEDITCMQGGIYLDL